MLPPLAEGSGTVVKFGGFIMILELHRQGLKVAAIARQLGIDRKTVRKYISRGLEPPTYGPRPHRQKSTDPFLSYLRERLVAFPGLTAVRLWREMRERGYAGGYTAVKVRDIRPEPITPFEVRFSPLFTSFPKENFRWRLFPASRQLPQVYRQFSEGRLNFLGEGLAEDFPMLGLGRAAVPCCATLQTSDPVIVPNCCTCRFSAIHAGTGTRNNAVSRITSPVEPGEDGVWGRKAPGCAGRALPPSPIKEKKQLFL
jgi:Winged helix-turn helix